jgi:methyltransferase
MGLPQVVVLLVALQRLAEVVYARRNERRLCAAGGIERGARHYPLLVLLHAAWLGCTFLFVPPDADVSLLLLGFYAVLQAGRLWTIASLGQYWTTRVIEVPGAPRVRRGPYRYLRHPNYLIVALEIAVLPAAFGAWSVAGAFSVANAALLLWRLRVEEQALASREG